MLLNAENIAASNESRVTFAYVDLTSKAVLPMWQPADAIGGRSMTAASDWALDPTTSAATLGALGSALKAATQTPRFFRSLAQWHAVFLRYAAVAVSSGQLTWSGVVAHVDCVMRMAEEARIAGKSQFVAILYDDLVRRSLAERAAKRDPLLNIETALTKTNKEVSGLAESRLGQVLAAAGMASGASGHAPRGVDAALTSAESVMAKQSAAADALTRKAAQAVRNMAQQQESMEHRRLALEADGRGDLAGVAGGASTGQGGHQGGAKGGNGAPNKRQRKAKQFFEKKKSNKGAGKGGGKGGRNGKPWWM